MVVDRRLSINLWVCEIVRLVSRVQKREDGEN